MNERKNFVYIIHLMKVILLKYKYVFCITIYTMYKVHILYSQADLLCSWKKKKHSALITNNTRFLKPITIAKLDKWQDVSTGSGISALHT
jgi:hypothetical protein